MRGRRRVAGENHMRLSGLVLACLVAGSLACGMAGLPPLAAAAAPSATTDGQAGAGGSLAADRASSALDARTASLIPNDDLTDDERDEAGASTGFLPADLQSSSSTHVTIGRLAGADEALDGTLVTFTGEVVGEPVHTVSGRWVQLQSSDASAIMVFMSEEAAGLIENYADYNTKGSTLRITGIYRVADPNNYGDLDVTAYVVTLVDEGGPVTRTVDMPLLYAAVASLLVAAALVGVNVYLRRRRV